MKKMIFFGFFLALLSGCAATTQDDSLARRTAFGLGVDAKDVIISDVNKGLQRIEYRAKVKGSVYNCYVVVMFATSDAMCSKRGGGAATKNPLLR
jgi:hypothetical protein